MIKHKSLSEKIFQVFNYIFLTVFCFCLAYPMWHVIMYSLSDRNMIGTTTTFFLPQGFSLDAYKVLLKDDGLLLAFRNSLFTTGMHTFLCIFTSFMVAYPLAQEESFKGRKLFSYYILIVMRFNGGLVPTYLLMRSLGLLNSLWALILPGVSGLGFCFILRKFIQQIPHEIREAAISDGAGEWRIMFQIIMPLCLPSIAYIAMMNIVTEWNSWFDCFIYIQDRSKYVIMAMMRETLFVYGSAEFLQNDPDALLQGGTAAFSEIVKQASTVLATLPILVLFPFLQKYFITGLTLGGVKG